MHSKNHKNIESKIDKHKEYSLDEAVELIQSNSAAKFDETIELHISLGINPDKTEQQVRGSIVLPHGGIIKRRVAAFVPSEMGEKAKKAGADLVCGKEEIEEIKKTNKCDFDIAIAHPDMMKELSKISRVLGPKRLMPTPKNGTVTEEVEKTIKELKTGKVFFRNDSGGNIHVAVGKVSWDLKKIKENINTLIEELKTKKPSKIKRKNFFQKVSLSSTMGPSIKI